MVHASWVLQMPASHLLSVLSLLSWAHPVHLVDSYKRDSKGGGVALKCLERKLQSACDEHPVCPCSQRAWWLDPALLQGLKILSAGLESRAIFAVFAVDPRLVAVIFDRCVLFLLVLCAVQLE